MVSRRIYSRLLRPMYSPDPLSGQRNPQRPARAYLDPFDQIGPIRIRGRNGPPILSLNASRMSWENNVD